MYLYVLLLWQNHLLPVLEPYSSTLLNTVWGLDSQKLWHWEDYCVEHLLPNSWTSWTICTSCMTSPELLSVRSHRDTSLKTSWQQKHYFPMSWCPQHALSSCTMRSNLTWKFSHLRLSQAADEFTQWSRILLVFATKPLSVASMLQILSSENPETNILSIESHTATLQQACVVWRRDRERKYKHWCSQTSFCMRQPNIYYH